MALLPILQYPHPTLAANAEPVTEFNDELKELATNMAETMYAAPGVGLAANQVGVLKRIIVIDVSEESNELRVFVNPQVIAHSDELEEFEEGCLSLKGLYEKLSAQNASPFERKTWMATRSSLKQMVFWPCVFSTKLIT